MIVLIFYLFSFFLFLYYLQHNMKRILITGSSGLIGSHLSTFLSKQGYNISHLVRKKNSNEGSEIYWDPTEELIANTSLEGFDTVIHLAGATIASWPWNQNKKALIKNSRVQGTHFLSKSLAELRSKPPLLICASAIGYYGHRGEELLDESSPAGRGFLSQVCQEWEAAADPAKKAGIRVAQLRFGMVLNSKRGALAKMLPAFKAGLGGKIGNGKQYMSWITLEEVVRIIKYVSDTPVLNDPINVVSPNPVTNEEFTKCLGQVLSRPVHFTLPSFILKTTLGQMADELLLASTRVTPKKLIDNGFSFQHAQLEPALKSILGK
jgi:uncharacterized protein (TIGR01777 family)